jgi:hypothetical protein
MCLTEVKCVAVRYVLKGKYLSTDDRKELDELIEKKKCFPCRNVVLRNTS